MTEARVRADLSTAGETALWTLHHRATEASRPDRLLDDPLAIELRDRIDYPFLERFGPGFPAQAQIQAMRVLTFDAQVRGFLAAHPGGTVVALGEGLETQFWRVDNGEVRWLTVELPAIARLRARLLPCGPRQRIHSGSATDPEWTELVDRERPVLITAQGLLMYLPPSQVRALIAGCADRFPGATFVFDAIPHWMGRAVERGTGQKGTFRPPLLPWCLDPDQLPTLRSYHPRVDAIRDLRPPPGRGLLGWLLPRIHKIPVLRKRRPSIVALHFSD